MAVIGSLAVNIVAKTDQLQKGLKRSQKHVKDFDRGIGASIGTLRKWHAAIIGVAGASGLGLMIRQQFREIDALGKTADKLGITTEALGGLRHAADLAGVASNTLDMGLQRMVRRVSEAAKGTGEAKAALAELGVSAASLAKLAPEQQFGRLADALNKVNNQSDRIRLAFKLFDSEGVALLNLTKEGSAGLGAMADEAERLGKTLSRIEVSRIERANDEMTRLNARWAGLKQQAAISLAEPAGDFLESTSRAIDQMKVGFRAIKAFVDADLRPRGERLGINSAPMQFLNVGLQERFNKVMADLGERRRANMAGLSAGERPAQALVERTRGLGDRIGKLTNETTRLWNEFRTFPAKMQTDALVNNLRVFGRFIGGMERQDPGERFRRAFDFSGFQSFMRFGRDLAFRPQQFGTPSMNAALEAGTREAFIAQRSGRRQEFLQEVAKLQKEEVNISKEIKGVLNSIWDTLKDTGGNIISIPT